MRWNILYIIIGVSLVLVGCSSDSTDERDDSGKTKQEHPLSMSMGMAPLQGEMRAAGDLPTGYSAYAYTTALAPINDIVCFLTADNTSSDQPEITTCHFIHEEESGNHVWKSRVVIQDGNYHLYGYMPNVSATNVSIAKPTGGSYTDGAVITLTGLNAVMPEDICVIEGFKQYDTTIPDMSDAVGKFVFNTSNGDNLYVLASHIYAAMQIKMKLGTEYAKLRKIKLRSITLTPVSGSDAASRVGAVITINGSGVQTVTFTTNSTETLPAMLYGVEGTELTTADQAFQAFLCPALPASSRYVMETRYDVYDRHGNLIRENESAENTLTHPSLAAGQKYDINITVNPTYLYQLSDPDLDDPMFTLE